MRDIIGLTVGLFVGATVASLVWLSNDLGMRRDLAASVPIEQCIAAILSIKPNKQE